MMEFSTNELVVYFHLIALSFVAGLLGIAGSNSYLYGRNFFKDLIFIIFFVFVFNSTHTQIMLMIQK